MYKNIFRVVSDIRPGTKSILYDICRKLERLFEGVRGLQMRTWYGFPNITVMQMAGSKSPSCNQFRLSWKPYICFSIQHFRTMDPVYEYIV